MFCGDRFYPLGVIINACEDPFMIATRWRIDITYEIKTPLLERGFKLHQHQGKGRDFLSSNKKMALMVDPNKFMHIKQ